MIDLKRLGEQQFFAYQYQWQFYAQLLQASVVGLFLVVVQLLLDAVRRTLNYKESICIVSEEQSTLCLAKQLFLGPIFN